MPEARKDQQADGLRRLFSPMSPHLLPVIVPAERSARHLSLLVHLAQALARDGQRVVLVDAARQQVAAALGLRARHDLLHALLGECRMSQVLLDAAPRLRVVPALRAFEEAADHRIPVDDLLRPLITLGMPDTMIVALTADQARLLARGEVLVTLRPGARDLRVALQAITSLAAHTEIATFRLIFIDFEPEAARTLADRMQQAIARGAGEQRAAAPTAQLLYGGAVNTALDMARLAKATAGWTLARLGQHTTEAAR